MQLSIRAVAFLLLTLALFASATLGTPELIPGTDPTDQSSPQPPPPVARPAPTPVQAQWQRGIAYVAYAAGLYSTADSDRSLEALAATGAGWISLTVTCYQATVYSRSIKCLTYSQTPTDGDLIHVVQKAHSLGLKVMLKPSVDLENDAHWRGDINFGREEAAWAEWFASYRSMIVHYAQLAQTYGFDQFSIGAELVGTTQRENDWRSIIAAVRAIYSGPLTYAANFGGEEDAIRFWDALDLIGVDAYYPLTNKLDPTLEELKSGWSPHLERLQALSQRWKRPIVFTELGYRSVDGTNMAPWDWRMQGAVDLQEQANCYQAFFEVFRNEPWFRGVFWWAWLTDLSQGGPHDSYYSPYHKPVGDILRYFFSAIK